MNKFLISLFAILIFASGAAYCSYSGSISISTITCSVTLPLSVPHIYHTPLSRISAITRIGVATGTVTDSIGLSDVSINYWTDNYRTVTTSVTSISSDNKSYNFKFSVTVPEGAVTFYYYIAVDNSSGWRTQTATYTAPINIASVSQSISSAGGTIILPSGDQSHGDTSITIPAGALSSTEIITITEVSPTDSSINPFADGTRPLAAYKFTPEGLLFGLNVTLNLYFPDPAAGTEKSDLKIMWWDGIEWRLVGGTANADTDLVTAYTNHFSLYAVFPLAALNDDDYRPKEKIITPSNQDGINDYATFGGLGPDDTVNIFDVRGRKVRQLSNTNIWNGKNDGGSFVETGVYVYQIKVNGKVISGVIAVAK